jgi:uncharacterized protein YtpQ (UPF0354 family)
LECNWDYLKRNRQIELWDILYNAKGNEYDIESEQTSKRFYLSLKKIQAIFQISKQTAIQISKIKFSRSYAALSLKAIEKIMPLVRSGKYFSSDFSESLKETIIKLVNETVSDPFEKVGTGVFRKQCGSIGRRRNYECLCNHFGLWKAYSQRI